MQLLLTLTFNVVLEWLVPMTERCNVILFVLLLCSRH